MASYSWEAKKDIPAGFFRQPGAENVAAVLASNEATLTKFNRMGFIAGFGNEDVFIGREGAMLDLETNRAGPFRYQTKMGEVSERWSDGLWVFHNPKARNPIPLSLFPHALHVFLDGNGQRNYRSKKRYHIIRSFTQIIRSSDSSPA